MWRHYEDKFNHLMILMMTHLGVLLAAGSIFALLGFAMGEEDEAIGLSCAEIKRDGSHPLGVPLGEADVGLGGLEGNGIQSGHVLTLVGYLSLDFHLRVHNPSQAGQLEPDVIVLIYHL